MRAIQQWTSVPNSHGSARRSALAPALREIRYEGRALGGFHIAREIACGGMATVYLAHRVQHARVGQAAAVKIIHPHLARNEEFVNMFLDEARIVSSISHPNVCRVLDFGHSDDTYYLAMEYVMGESLADLMVRLSTLHEASTVAVPLITQVIYQVCEALHAVHETRDTEGNPLHVVHRDVSPQNVMVGYDGCVRVLDFGVARASERLQVTRAGVIKGRLCYMAPEQMSGATVDRRADVWSLGVVLWEGLAGRRLFRRDSEIETVRAVTRDPLPPLTNPTRSLPASLQRIVARALERDPDRRYATTRELGLDLLRSEAAGMRFSMSDVSSWMQTLFASSIAHKRVLLRDAAHGASAARLVHDVRPPATADRGEIDIDDVEDDDDEEDTRISLPVPSQLRRPADNCEGPSECAPLDPTQSGIQPTSSGRRRPAEYLAPCAPAPSPAGGVLRRSCRLVLSLAAMTMLVAVPRPCGELAQAGASSPLGMASSSAAVVASAPLAATPTPMAALSTPLAPADASSSEEASGASDWERMSRVAPDDGSTPKKDNAETRSEQSAPSASTAPRPAEHIVRGPTMGVVNVTATSGWADVFIGPRKLGRTPLSVSLPAGVRTLRVLPQGKGPALVRRVAVHAKAPTELTLALD